MDTSASSSTQLVYQIIQQQLKAVGITAEIKNYDESSWLDLRKSGEMDAFVANWTMDYNDPANIMYTFFGSAEKTKLRSLNYADTAVMAASRRGLRHHRRRARMKEYQDLGKDHRHGRRRLGAAAGEHPPVRPRRPRPELHSLLGGLLQLLRQGRGPEIIIVSAKTPGRKPGVFGSLEMIHGSKYL
jgi:hypothetical protein